MPQCDIGLIGLAVMGKNLVLNMADHGTRVAVYNRTTSKVDEFIAGEAAGKSICGAHTIEDLVGMLEKPRRVMLMIKAGGAVDATIDSLLPYLEAGDIIIDGGNSNYHDTIRRVKMLEEKGLRFIGTGISGGEEGARFGPSIMPGGSSEAWPYVKDIFQGIAAKVAGGAPCCDWVGESGAGHFVKMVHNGIEYGDMQLIAEAYDLMHRALGMDHDAMAATFGEWLKGRLDSYLIEITRDILAYRDNGGEIVLERILDAAGQKGTGRWTAEEALAQGIPLNLIIEAVLARSLSALKEERVRASGILAGETRRYEGDRGTFLADLEDALYAAKIISYAQGYMLMRAAGESYGWHLNYGGIAQMWRGGCIIRAAFLDDIKAAYDRDPGLENLLFDPFFKEAIAKALPGWRRVVSEAALLGLPVPALSSALAFYDGMRSERLPANLIQAQRDYFGAHTYERVDRPRGEFTHTDWTGRGGDTTASTYDA